MAKPLIPLVKSGYYASNNWTPFVKADEMEAEEEDTSEDEEENDDA